jgi:hypothetical protein
MSTDYHLDYLATEHQSARNDILNRREMMFRYFSLYVFKSFWTDFGFC